MGFRGRLWALGLKRPPILNHRSSDFYSPHPPPGSPGVLEGMAAAVKIRAPSESSPGALIEEIDLERPPKDQGPRTNQGAEFWEPIRRTTAKLHLVGASAKALAPVLSVGLASSRQLEPYRFFHL